MKLICFILLLITFPILANSQCYVSNPEGALAFSTTASFDKVISCCSVNDKECLKKLINNNEIRILDPGIIVKIQSKTDLVVAVTIEGSSKLWAVPMIFITCKNKGK